MSSEESGTGVGHHLRTFAANTSLRGVSRIVKSSDTVLRVLWTLAVVSCAAMLVYQLSCVVSQYLRYEFSTVTKEDIRSRTVRLHATSNSMFIAFQVSYDDYWHYRHSMRSGVYATVGRPSVRPSVRLSHPAAVRRRCGFSAVGPAARRSIDRSN